jgi:hypothetical protein
MSEQGPAEDRRAERLALCALVRTRFRGRSDLEARASHDELALLELEGRLGLITEAALDDARLDVCLRRYRGTSYWNEVVGYALCPDGAARRAMMARRYATGRIPPDSRWIIARVLAPDECARVDRVRADREERRRVADLLATRKPRHAESVIIRRRALELYERAQLRSAKHDHETRIRIVDPGCETARSSTGSVSPGSVGLPKTYARKGYSVTSSMHELMVSREILRAEVQKLTEPGVLYLSEAVRVRSGRGTSLVVETRSERGAWRRR